MFGSSRSFLDRDVEDWHLECWAWLLRYTGGIDQMRISGLVLPIKDHFTLTELQGHAKAQHIFNIVREHCGMQDWPVRLVAQRETATRVATFGTVQNPGDPVGTYSRDKNAVQITYAPSDLSEPMSLVATFAHELGHYLNTGFPEGPPGGWDLIEPATDVTAAFLGFGVFGANSAFHFTRTQDFESQGWSTERRGYITEAEWAFSIALFCALTGENVEIAKPHLKPHLAKQTIRAARYVEKNNIADRVLESR